MSKIAKKENAPKYKIVNWSEYNKSLENRGSITFWFEEQALESWSYDGPQTKGGQYQYSDLCIECLLGIKCVYKLQYRQLVGFVKSIFKLMGLDKKVPSYSQISRRAGDLKLDLDLPYTKQPIHLVFDSTGLKVYGEGEWKVRKHGYSKRRTWRKLHLGVDEKKGLIYAHSLTENDVDDASQLEPMLDQLGEQDVSAISADGAYDKDKCWAILEEWGIQGIIPPRKDAVYWTNEYGQILDHERNKILSIIDRIGLKAWKKESNYHRRSLSETAMMRYKLIFTQYLFSRVSNRQRTEAGIKVKMLNKMTGIGMPISVKVC